MPRSLGVLSLLACLTACPPGETARLYATSPKAPSLDAAKIEALDHLGPTLIDKGVNFGVYSERAERIELLLFDDPESTRPTRQFPMQRFKDVWNLYVEGVGIGQHYGYIAFGPNFTYDSSFIPGSLKGFKADLDAEGNRFNPNKLLIDPYAKAIHRDHDWSKGSTATGYGRADSTYAAASKGVVVKSRYQWSEHEARWRAMRQDENAPGHRWNDVIMYELHPKGFTASPASGVEHPGTYLGLAEKADYLKDLGVTAVHLMPIHEKPLEGGYWGYMTLNFFIPERTYSFRKEREEVMDEFKYMVDQFHQRGIEVILDVVYNHTGEGGLWRDLLDREANPDPRFTGQLANFDPREVAGLYSFRGLDNHAYYALSPDKQDYWNNAGVGNQTRANHVPFRRLIMDSLRYAVEELHVDGFRFDLAPVLGEKDLVYYHWDDPKNTVLQEIADDPLLQRYNTRLVAEPWAAGGYDERISFNGPGGPGANPFHLFGGMRLGVFPASSTKPGTGWGEWNGRFRDWWRNFFNFDGLVLGQDEDRQNRLGTGGDFLTGSKLYYDWNSRRPYHSVNFITVHDGFPMYDLVSYDMKFNGCGPLNPVCCQNPFSAWCEKQSGDSHNRSRDWGKVEALAKAGLVEDFKRQNMRNWFTVLMISHGTPLLWAGDEWMRTQLGNNNAYTVGADNPYNWMDWGTYQSQDHRHRMHDFVRQLVRFRKEHLSALAPAEYDGSQKFAWKTPANADMSGDDWNSTRAIMIHYYEREKGPELAILINGGPSDVTFTLPQNGLTWRRLVDTQLHFDRAETLQMNGLAKRKSNNIWLDDPEAIAGTYGVTGRSIVILEAQ